MVAPAADTAPARPVSALSVREWPLATWLPVCAAAVAFVLLFASPVSTLFHDWLHDDDANYGLLLFPVAIWLAWRSGLRTDAAPDRRAGTILLIAATLIRLLGSVAAEFFSQRFAIWLAIVGLIVFCFGWRQIRSWWLPLVVLLLAIPLPALFINQLAIPLQFQASRLGTAMIHWRHIPVRTQGNVIQIPEAMLFVAEACSGLRSLSALIALGVLLGGMYLGTVVSRIVLIALVVPVAVLLNGVRIFLTAFLIHFVDPSLGTGLAHEREGMLMFVAAFAILGGCTAVVRLVERTVAPGALNG
jgi:exosortase